MNEKYLDAVKTIKTAILRSQCRITKQGNAELLSLYYGIGGYVSGNSRKGTWGTGAIDEISSRLRADMPGLRGFSAANIKFMRQFYEAWQPYLQNKSDDLQDSKSLTIVSDLEQIENNQLKVSQKSLPMVRDFPMEVFTQVSFTHHMEILRKTSSLEERFFYIRECASGSWSKTVLQNKLKEDLYHHQGALSNNFSTTMSNDKQYLKAIRMFKDEYLLDFINTEELDISDLDDLDERVLEKEIIDHIRNFIQCLGSGFCFVGNQYRIEVGGEELLPANYKVLAPIIEEVPKMLDYVEAEKNMASP